jgi:hypothetical protein
MTASLSADAIISAAPPVVGFSPYELITKAREKKFHVSRALERIRMTRSVETRADSSTVYT